MSFYNKYWYILIFYIFTLNYKFLSAIYYLLRVRHGRDRMVVGFTSTCAVSAYYHWSCEFESHSWQGVLDTILCDKFVSDMQQVSGFLRVLRFPQTIKLTCTISLHIVESGIKYHKPNQTKSIIYYATLQS